MFFHDKHVSNDIEQERMLKNSKLLSYKNEWYAKKDDIKAKNMFKSNELNYQQQQLTLLYQRRTKLKYLYHKEMIEFKKELSNLKETPHERTKRLLKEAQEKKLKREQERKNYVNKMYEKQRIENSDEIRSIQSNQFKNYLKEQLEIQRKLKAKELQQAKEDEIQYLKNVENIQIKQQEKEAKELYKKKQLNLQYTRNLLQQIEEEKKNKKFKKTRRRRS